MGSEVLTYKSVVFFKVGLTATPQSLELHDEVKLEKGALEDARITADNIAYFGEPAYSYDISQAVEDGYLAVCEIVRRDVFLQTKTANERETGLDASDLTNVIDPITGRPGMAGDGAHYEAESFEADIVLPERTKAMAEDLFRHMLATGGPHQKTIVFCVRDLHAEQVAPRNEQPLRRVAPSAGAECRRQGRPLRVQMHGGIRGCHDDRRLQGRRAFLLRRDHRRSAVDRRRRAGGEEHRVLPLSLLANRLLSDGRARTGSRRAS